jgi:hypothetical protein
MLLALVAAAPGAAQARWTLVEEWRIGGDPDGHYAFDDARDIRLDAQGNAIVLDFKAQQLRVYDRAGKHVRSVGRKGSGPGEFREANGMVVLRDGRIVVNDPPNGRWAVLSPELEFQRHTPKSIRHYGFQWEGFVDTEGRLVEAVPLPVVGLKEVSGSGLRRWRPDLETADTVPAAQCTEPPREDRGVYRLGNERAMSFLMVPFVAPIRGAIRDRTSAAWAVEPADSRVIRRYAHGSCTVTATIRLAGPPRGVTAEERADAVAPIEAAAKRHGVPVPDLSLIPRTHPAFDQLHVDAENRLWVERVSSDGAVTRFEVYDATGKPVATIEHPRLRSGFIAPRISADRFVGFVRDEDDIPHLVSWRIRR